MTRALLCASSLLLCCSLSACGPEEDNASNNTTPTPPDLTNPKAGDVGAAAAGEELYGDNGCAGCHMVDGSASDAAKGKALSDTAANKSDGYIFTIIKGGSEALKGVEGIEGGMPPYAALSDEEVWELVTFIRTYAPAS